MSRAAGRAGRGVLRECCGIDPPSRRADSRRSLLRRPSHRRDASHLPWRTTSTCRSTQRQCRCRCDRALLRVCRPGTAPILAGRRSPVLVERWRLHCWGGGRGAV